MTNEQIRKANDLDEHTPILHHLRRVNPQSAGQHKAQHGGRTIYHDGNGDWAINGKKIGQDRVFVVSAR